MSKVQGIYEKYILHNRTLDNYVITCGMASLIKQALQELEQEMLKEQLNLLEEIPSQFEHTININDFRADNYKEFGDDSYNYFIVQELDMWVKSKIQELKDKLNEQS